MSPTLHLICGMAGAGKTTLAKKLERALPAVRLSPDEWISPLLETPNDRPEMDRIRPVIERLQWTLGQRLLSLGTSVILEQGFWARDERLAYLETARLLGATVILHYLDVPKEELARRIEERNKRLPPGSFLVYPGEIATWMTWLTPPDQAELAHYDDYKIYRYEP